MCNVLMWFCVIAVWSGKVRDDQAMFSNIFLLDSVCFHGVRSMFCAREKVQKYKRSNVRTEMKWNQSQNWNIRINLDVSNTQRVPLGTNNKCLLSCLNGILLRSFWLNMWLSVRWIIGSFFSWRKKEEHKSRVNINTNFYNDLPCTYFVIISYCKFR